MPAPDEKHAAPRHWIVPFAASLSEPCAHALPRLDAPDALPHWAALMGQLEEMGRTPGDEYALSTPHERVLAELMGWADTSDALADGAMPWAVWWAHHDGVALTAGQPWGLLTPGHWLMGRDHMTLLDPDSLAVTEADSRAAYETVRELFESDGWTLLWGAPTRWYASHPSLAGLPTASLDRVIGRNPDVWLTDHPQARVLRRLQSEVQMVLYHHPVNDRREAAGLPTLNSFWLSGCGMPGPNMVLPPGVELVDTLRAPMLADDMASWLAAWQQLDGTVLKHACALAQAGAPVRLTLCGERHAVTLGTRRGTGNVLTRLWQGLRGAAAPRPSAWLTEL